MYMDGKSVLHLVGDATRFSAARFLSKVSIEAIWEGILTCRATAYADLPHKLMVDQDSQFQKTFAELAKLHEVKIGQTRIQSHN